MDNFYVGKFFSTGRIDDYLEFKRSAKKTENIRKERKDKFMNF